MVVMTRGRKYQGVVAAVAVTDDDEDESDGTVAVTDDDEDENDDADLHC